MPRIPRALWLAPPLAYLLYLYSLGAAGLIGPDEPRYASIARQMARSGDWITPRLWGEPWFEKSPLLYWMQGAAFRLGLGSELAPRLPVALAAIAFLGFYWWLLRREFGGRAAWLATLILGTSAGWIAVSQVGVTDLPLTAAFSAAMLLALPWIARGDARFLPAAAALLALAVLAKYLVPLVLAIPLALGYRRWRDLVRPRVLAPFLVVALPWYALCWLRNGRAFIDVFWQHQFGRFVSGALMHVQPWWFYLPVLAGVLLPWTPLLALAARHGAGRDARRRFLWAWVLFGLVFFSAATNKLPGYLLPLLPPAAALLALALDEAAGARGWLACCGLLLVAFPLAAPMLPAALGAGLSHAPLPAFHWSWLLAAAAAALAWNLEQRGRRLAAVLVIACGAAVGTAYLKRSALAAVDRAASARTLWQTIDGRADAVCVDHIQRTWRYGLDYYSAAPLPECSLESRPLWVRQSTGEPPYLAPAPAAPLGREVP